ncbi:MAG TPA: alcohol dehydrogenase catalytic domain-containing protein [Candidatus Nanoarchaeia archaeon]|nr:alcohol dehydrogenase catalytic domain-containing protein [Candidatus Nanoarchaeia archaeon]
MKQNKLARYGSLDSHMPPDRYWAFVQRGEGIDSTNFELWETPSVTDNAVLLRVDASVICTSDVKNIWTPYARERIVGADGKSGFDIEGTGIVNGHEATLTVVKVGDKVQDFNSGDRVVLQADLRGYANNQAVGYRVFGAFRGFAQWGPVVQEYLIKLDRDIGYIEAALVEGPTCAYASHQVGPVRDDDHTVWINGVGGPMGNMHTEEILLRRKEGKYQGITTLVVSDLDAKRLQAYEQKFGAELASAGVRLLPFNPSGMSGGLPNQGEFRDLKIDYYLELAPIADVTLQNLQALRDHAVINVYSSYNRGEGPIQLASGQASSLKAIHSANTILEARIGGRPFVVTGNSGSTLQDMRDVLKRLEDGKINTYGFAEAVTGWQKLPEALEAQHDRKFNQKICVLNQVADLPLTAISDLTKLPVEWGDAIEDIEKGRLTRRVEDALLEHYL